MRRLHPILKELLLTSLLAFLFLLFSAAYNFHERFDRWMHRFDNPFFRGDELAVFAVMVLATFALYRWVDLRRENRVRIATEERLSRSNRNFRMVSACNQAMIHAADEASLLQEVCEVIVTVGGYRMAWVGFAEYNAAQTVRVAATAGHFAGYLADAQMSWSDNEYGRSPVGTAIRTGTTVCNADTAANPHFGPWRAAALARGYLSSIGLPITIDGRTIGMLGIYAAEKGCFGEAEEVALLEELAGDLAYGIQEQRLRAAHALTLSELTTYKEHLEELVDKRTTEISRLNQQIEFVLGATKTGLDIIDEEYNVVYIDPAWGKVYGNPAGKKCYEYFMGKTARCPNCGIEKAFRTKERVVVEEILAREGNRPVEVTTIPFRGPNGKWFVAEVNVDITERKKAMAAADEERRRFHAVFDQTFELIGIMAVDGTLIEANKTALDFTGVKAADVLDRPFWETPWWRHSPALQRQMRDAVTRAAAGEFVRFEATHPKASDGTLGVIDFSLKPIKDAAGKVVFLIPEGRDITARKKVEAELAASEKKFRTIFDHTVDGILVADAATGHFVLANAVICRMLGYDEAELRQLSIRDIHPDETLPHITNLFERMRRREVFIAPNLLVRRKNGSTFYADIGATPVEIDARECIVGIFRDVTQRRKTQEALRESEERYRVLFETSPDAIGLFDVEGRLVMSNLRGTKIFGFKSEDEERARPIMEFLAPEDRERGQRAFREVFTAETVVPLDFTACRKDGTTFAAEGVLAAVRDADKKVRYVLASMRDITDRKRLEEALHRTLDDYEKLVKSLPGAVYKFRQDTAGQYSMIYMTDRFADITGIAKEQALADFNLILNALLPEDREHLLKTIAHSAATLGEWYCEFRVRDGSRVKWISGRSTPAAQPDGSIVWNGILTDITSLKTIGEALKESEEKYRAVVDNIGIGVALISPRMEVLAVNNQMRRWFPDIDEAAKPICYRTFNDPAREAICTYCPTTLALADGEIHEAITETPRLGGITHYRVIASPVKDDEGRIVAAVEMVEDITERQKTEAELARYRGHLEEIVKARTDEVVEKTRDLQRALQIKSDFTDMVSHELRTPLGAIKESISLVSEETAGPLNEKQQNMLSIAKRNVDRLARLINDVLDFQKLESGRVEFKMRRYQLNDIVDEVYRTMLSVAGRKGIGFTLELDRTLPRVRCDRDRIVQVLVNLVSNAIKFTERGRVAVQTAREGNCVRIAVSDTGKGISKDQLGKIFEKFVQLERKPGGSGLGLVISKEIVERHKGKIWVESVYGTGTTVIFLLPIVERRADHEQSDTDR